MLSVDAVVPSSGIGVEKGGIDWRLRLFIIVLFCFAFFFVLAPPITMRLYRPFIVKKYYVCVDHNNVFVSCVVLFFCMR